jgi:hypothetical protein
MFINIGYTRPVEEKPLTTLEDLATRLDRHDDIEAARGILFDYARTLDEPDPRTVGGMFAEDGVLHTTAGSWHGRTEIEEFFARAFAADPAEKRHLITNAKLTWLAAGQVRIDSYFLFVGRGADRSVIGWGTYLDIVDVSGAHPLFAEKTIDVHLNTTLDEGWAAAPSP